MFDFSKVDQILTEKCAEGKIPSATLCVYQGGKIVHEAAYGIMNPETGEAATPETRYDMASLTKLFVTTAFIRLVEQGVFSLEEKVCESFPEFTGSLSHRIRQNRYSLSKILGASIYITPFGLMN